MHAGFTILYRLQLRNRHASIAFGHYQALAGRDSAFTLVSPKPYPTETVVHCGFNRFDHGNPEFFSHDRGDRPQ